MANISVYVTYGSSTDDSRFFCARATRGGKTLKTKTFSIGKKRNESGAYKEASKAASELGVEFGVEPTIYTMKETISRFTAKSANKGSGASESGSSNALVEKFGHAGRWKALIVHAIKRHGPEKVKEVLESGLSQVNEAIEALNRDKTVISATNRKIAEAILSARDSGVNMPAPNPEIESAIDGLIAARARASSTKKARKGSYELNGEKWDGSGHIPANFAKYLQDNESHDLDDLRV